MPVIGLCGLQGCGKSVIAEELVEKHGFKQIHLTNTKVIDGFVSLEDISNPSESSKLKFSSVDDIFDFMTNHWKENFVISCLREEDEFATLLKRPFFMVLAVMAPVQVRYERCAARSPGLSLLDLVKADDEMLYGRGLVHVLQRARLTISNGATLDKLRELIGKLNLDERWIRPTWDSYFMEMAELASRRSNCMKRLVGCVIVKDKRVIATGYNGTARNLQNCCDGGCPRCNSNAKTGVGLEHCYCLHGEENALLEAGRSRCEGATIYCTTVPCLGCSQKIIQCGVIRIVYTREYSMEHNASDMMKSAGVELVKFSHDVPHYMDANEV